MTIDKGMSMNGQPIGGGGVSMNGQPTGVPMNGGALPVAHATPTQSAAAPPPVAYPMSGAAPPVAFPMHEQEKIGSKCCGCCCDFRRAVIILDSCLMVLSVLGLIFLALPSDVSEQRYQQLGIDDDQVADVLMEMTTITQIISGCGVVALAVPVFGAMKYNTGMVAFGIAWFVITYVAQVAIEVVYTGKANDVGQKSFSQPFINWIVSAIISALFVYPHVGLISEINQGIMSQATYPREAFSCCCGPN
ncbi:expressed unknown protein [Seminavis robusta]|uniref:Uncharacterized protein n=1 Tax=Seminavis robusta TaxID=568900 RepID=A0A9N8EZH7_9STRA|nr:expressed unknown protein [Seminavis robusta]|eukprot:Sro2226_g319810.1 n/a (248) ;mRNA; r:3055-3798